MTFSATFLTFLVFGAVALAAFGALVLAALFLRDSKENRLW